MAWTGQTGRPGSGADSFALAQLHPLVAGGGWGSAVTATQQEPLRDKYQKSFTASGMGGEGGANVNILKKIPTRAS